MSNYNQNSVNNFDSVSTVHSPMPMINSNCIRSEIDRFESVHPSIYSIYELLEEIKNQPHVQSKIRDHIMIIEDSFVNSQEWTMSRSVLDVRIGLLGTLSSGKSSLVHRFLTGTYMQDESPEGGRFKKGINIENQNYLLLIRDEANAPDAQLTYWVDGIIFVFSLENEESFKTIYQYFTKMCHYRNMSEVPFILVGTQDGISESNPRIIHEDRARKLANELKRCTYYETCATYGLNVERVFNEVCHRIVQQRYGINTLSNRSITPQQQSPNSNQLKILTNSHSGPSSSHIGGNVHLMQTGSTSMQTNYRYDPQQIILSSPTPNLTVGPFLQTPTMNGVLKDRNNHQANLTQTDRPNRSFKEQTKPKSSNFNDVPFSYPQEAQVRVDPNEQLTPTSTPTQKRKDHKRRSNIFTPGKKEEEKHKVDRLGHGRAIPIKQGILYKKGTNSINREWKKKYVVLLDDGRMIYHPSFHDYENDAHGKEIILQRTTIKIPGVNKHRSLKVSNSEPNSNAILANDHHLSTLGKIETPNSKKRHRRQQTNHGASSTGSSTTSKSTSSHNGGEDDGDEYIFTIVSLDKQWFFEAQSNEERDEWVQAIEQQILLSLQNIESTKAARAAKTGGTQIADLSSVQAIKFVAGNGSCADCEQNNPTWASLNIGALICMECASLHRNLGTHLSRVRSLELDEWTSDLVQIMRSIGNRMVNSIWEANIKNRVKPQPNTSTSEREKWIRDKYEQKLFLQPVTLSHDQLRQSLYDAINDEDLSSVILLLAHGKLSTDDLNNTSIHLAASKGNVTILQLLLWHGADPFALDRNGLCPLQYAHNDCIQTLQNLTSNRNDSQRMFKQQTSISPLQSTVSTPRQPVCSPAPPYDKLPSTVI